MRKPFATYRPFSNNRHGIIFGIFSWIVIFSFSSLAQPVWQSADQQTAAASANTTVTCNAPTNLSAGDLIIFIVATQNSPNSATSAFSTPTGFTLIRSEHDNSDDNRPETAAYYKISDGTETTITCTAAASNGEQPDWKAVSGRVTNFDATTPIDVHSGDNSGNSTVSTITAPSVNTSNDNALLIAARNIRHNISSDNPPTGMTTISAQNGDGAGNSRVHDPALHVAQETLGVAGATGTRTFNWATTQRSSVLMFAINEVQCSPAVGNPSFSLGVSTSRCVSAGNVTYTATASNATGISYSLDATSLTAGNTINSSTGEVTYVSSWTDTATITVTATGCQGPTTANHIAITRDSISTPEFIEGTTSGRCIEHEVRVYGASADNDDSLVYSLDAPSISAGLLLQADIGTVEFPLTYSGTTVITATAYGCGGPLSADHTITTGTQVLQDDSVTIGPNQSIDIKILQNDYCDIDTATLTIVSAPSNGTATANTTTGQINYTPNYAFAGTDSIVYQFCGIDNPGTCSQATIYITVRGTYTDSYFNLPVSSCPNVLPNNPVLDIKSKFTTADNAALYCTPMIADLDGDGTVEIIVYSSNSMSTATPRSCKDLNVYSGITGATLYTITTPYIGYDGATPLAIADIDADGDCEIIVGSLYARNATADQEYLFCYDHLGTQLWKSNTQYGANAGANGSGASIGICDFNGDGNAEIYVYNEIFDAATGVKLADGGSNGIGRFSQHVGVEQSITAAADLTTSSGLELAAGRTVYEVTITNNSGTAGNSMTAINYTGGSTSAWDGYTGLADFDLDGNLDVVTIANNYTLYIWNPRTNTTLASYNTGSSGQRGPLFIGDVDGNGVPDIGYCRPNAVDMLSYDGTTTLALEWTLSTSDGSGETSLTMFDFDQNGVQEIIYRDETDLRIINGSNGSATNITTFPAESSTGNEGPVVADVDGDNEAEIIVTSEGTTGNGDRISMIEVFESDQNAWASARKVWNQFAYFNVNINDDLTIPTAQADHGDQYFTSSNNCPSTFRSRPLNSFNVQSTVYSDDGCPVSYLPDAEIVIDQAIYVNAVNTLTLTYDILNRADGRVLPANTDVSFYVGNPYSDPTATRKTTVQTPSAIEPFSGVFGEVVVLTGINEGDYVYGVVNDDGSENPVFELPVTSVGECNYENNIAGIQASAIFSLPVEILEFEAYRVNDVTHIVWTTGAEINNDFFVIQRSEDGQSFYDIDTVLGAGNSSWVIDYRTIDTEPKEGYNYYRLLQQDFDGEQSYSEIRAVVYETKHALVFPNPTKGNITIANPNSTALVEVYNLQGQHVESFHIMPGTSEKNLNKYKHGSYLMRFTYLNTRRSEVIKLHVLR